MVSKNNRIKRMEEVADHQSHFGIRKLTVGAASVLLGTTLWLENNNNIVKADTASNTGSPNQEQDSENKVTIDVKSAKKAVIIANNSQKTSAAVAANYNQKVVTDNSQNEQKSKPTVQSQKSVQVKQQSSQEVQKPNTTKVVAENNAQTQLQKARVNTANKYIEQTSQAVTQKTTTDKISTAAQQGQKSTNINSDTDISAVALKGLKNDLKSNDLQTKLNNLSKTTQNVGDKNDEKVDTKSSTETVEFNPEQETLLNAANKNLQKQLGASLINWSDIGKDIANAAINGAANIAKDINDKAAQNIDTSKFTTVTDGTGLMNAMLGGDSQGVNVKGDINLSNAIWGNTAYLSRTFYINGLDNASINLGTKAINNTGDLILNNVTINGTIKGTGTVQIKGKVTSNVDYSSSNTLTDDELNQQVGSSHSGVNTNNWKAANIAADRVIVDPESSLTVNRNIDGDGIVLLGGSASYDQLDDTFGSTSAIGSNGTLATGYNSHLNINLKGWQSASRSNENNSNIENANTGIRAENNGHLITGDGAEVNINAGHGRAIMFNEPFGGDNYVQQKSNLETNWYRDRSITRDASYAQDTNNSVIFGDSNKVHITGRDGILFGNRANFVTGDHSIIRIDSKGNGAGLLGDAFSNVEVSPQSQLLLTSDGKDSSGQWSGGNFIGLGENGQFRVEHDATFRYRMVNRGGGSNNYDDNMNIISTNSSSKPMVYVGTNATFDSQSDYRDYYGEIFAFPLGGSTEGVFQIDGAKYVNWEKNSINNDSGHGNLYYSMGKSLIDATANNGRSYYVFKWSSKNLNDNNITFDDSTPDTVKNSLQQFKDYSEEYWKNVTHLATTYSKGGNTAEFPGHFVDNIAMNGDATPGMKRGTALNNFSGRGVDGFNPENSQRLALVSTIIPVQKDQSAQAKVPYNVIVKVNKELKPGESKVIQQGKEGLKRITSTHYYNLDPSSGKYTLDTSKGKNGVSTTEKDISKEQDEIIEVGPQSATVNYIDEDNNSTIYTSTIESNHPYVDQDDGDDDGKTSLVFKAKTNADGTPIWQYLKDSQGNYVDAPIGKTITFINGKLAYTEATDTTNAKVPTGDQAVELKDASGNPVMVDVVNSDGEVIGKVPRVVVQTPVYEIQANPVTKKTFDKTVGVVTKTTHHNGIFGWFSHDTTSTSIEVTDATVTDSAGNKVDITGSGDTLVDKVINQLTTGKDAYKLDKNEFDTKKFTFDAIDKTTGQVITLDDIKNAFASTQSQTDAGQSQPAGYTVAANKLFNSVGPTVNVYFTKGSTKEEGTLTVVYHDTTLGIDLQGYGYSSPSEPVGTKITYTPDKTIADLEGYGLVPDYPDGKVPTDIIPKTYIKGPQKVVINVKHKYRPVTPTDPIDSNHPIDPDHPNNPVNNNLPKGYTKEDLQKTITRTINYLNSKDKSVLADPITQTVTFTGTGYVDEATGNLVNVDDANKKILDQNGKITWTFKDNTGKSGSGQNYDFITTDSKPIITKDGKEYKFESTDPSEYDNGQGSVKVWNVNTNQKDDKQIINVYYNQDIKDGTIEVVFHDTTDDVDIPNYGFIKTKKPEGTSFTYNPNTDLTTLENLGYVPNGTIPQMPKEYTSSDQRIVIPVKHGTRPVTPTDPIDPNHPIDPDHPTNPSNKNPNGYNYTPENLQKKVTRTFKYIFSDGSSHPDIKEDPQVVTFQGSGIVDKVTGHLVTIDSNGKITQNGKITWTPENGQFEKVAAKPVEGYKVTSTTNANSDGSVNAVQVNKDSSDIEVVVVYAPDKKPEPQDEQASLRIVDNNDPQNQIVLSSFNDSGKANSQITFAGSSATLNALLSQGYVFQSAKNDQTDSSIGSSADSIKYPVFDNNSEKAQSFTIYLTHKLIPVTPNDPHGQDPKTLTDTTKATVHYVISDGKVPAPADNVQTITWNRQETMDAVSGKLIPNGKYDQDWTPSKENYTNVNTPVVDWYTANKGIADFSTDKPKRGTNPEIIITYRPNGHVIPVDKNGNKIPDAKQPQFPTDPHNPTKTTNSSKPNVPGYHPQTGNPGDPVNPDKDPTKDVNVPYIKGNQIAQVIYRDLDENEKVLAKSGELQGQANTIIDYSTSDEITKLENQGYVLINNDFDPQGQKSSFDDVDGNVQTFYVDFKHGLQPVTPDNPGKPNEPINPDDPDGPKYLAGTSNKDLTVKVTRTIHYEGAGNKTPKDVVQTTTFTQSGVLDKVTGKWSTPLKWNKESDNLPEKTTPIFDYYHVVSVDKDSKDGINVDAIKVDHNSKDSKVTVVYAPNGKIVPVDKEGHEISGAKQPQYPTDPENPKNVKPDEDTPSVPGYHIDPNQTTPGVDPKDGTVTPVDPGKDTPVVYIKDKENQVTISVKYIDDTEGDAKQDISSYDKNFTQDAGSELTYTTQHSIDELVNRGFKLVSDSYSNAHLNGKMPDKDANYEVHLIHKTTPVNPNNPGTPGGKLNPKDPNPQDPKYPAGTSKNDIDKTISRTIHYVDNNGKHLSNDVVQSATFTAQGILDNVTGKWILPDGSQTADINKGLTWSKNQELSQATSPTIDGYHIVNVSKNQDGNNVKHVTITHTDSSYDVTVTYAPNGQDIINKKSIPSTQTVKYADTEGKELKNAKVQKSIFTYSGDVIDPTTKKIISKGDWNETSHTYTTESVPVIEGYVAIKGYSKDDDGNYVAGGKTATLKNPNVVATVVYAKIGKIVPVDPNGNNIPDSPTPSYKNDPNDPTKVTPKEPVPNIPGYTPDIPTVTPDDPTKDTPVIYRKNPDIKKQIAEVIYQDINDPKKIVQLATSGRLSGDAGDKIDYSTSDEIKALTNKGYILVNDGFKNAIFDDDTNNQIFYVTFKHGTTTVTPNNPGHPGQPVDPNNPDGPKYPEGTALDDLKRTATQTVHYTGAGDKTPKDDVQSFTFTKKITFDNVTGDITDNGSWNVTTHTFGDVTTPVIKNYHADKRTAGNTVVTPDDLTKKVTVTYTPNGHIVPVDPNGNKIPNVPTPQYPTDPSDPTRVTPDEPVPSIPGYTPKTPTVTPDNPGEDTPVIYTPVDNTQRAQLMFVDDNDSEKSIAAAQNVSGKANMPITFVNSAQVVQALISKGYEFKSVTGNGIKADSDFNKVVFPEFDTISDVNGDSQVFTVHFIHGTQPVTPDNPGHPGQPIDPNDPDGPKYPTDYSPSDLIKNVTRTINYVDNNGHKISGHDSIVQTVQFDGKGVFDKVTGKWITPITFDNNSKTVNGQSSPLIENYHITRVSRDSKDNVNVDSATVKYNTDSYSVDVVYTPNGHIVPVDPEGHKIPNAPTPQYPTNPKNPAGVNPNEPVPSIPGYIPTIPTVTPDNPATDTPVIYTPVDDTQHAVVIYQDINDPNHIVQITSSGDLSGKANTVISYSIQDEIKNLINKGYVLKEDGFKKGTKFDNDKTKNQIFYVTFVHGTQPVTPTNPGKPGQPINPNDPNGPKYPNGSNIVTHDVTRTINYVDNNGQRIGNSIVQTAHFTGNGLIDKVTGQWITPITWSGNGNMDSAKTPVIENYHVTRVSRDSKDNVNVDSAIVKYNTDSYSVDVIYTPNGHIIPVDPEGHKIPNVPTPQYPTDPKNPAKVVPNEPVPTIPNMNPSQKTVTPVDPGKDTPVIYINNQGSVEIIVHDITTDTNLDQYGYNSKTVSEGTKVDYDWNSIKKTLTDHGYIIVTKNISIPSVVGKTGQTITINVEHDTVPVNPTNPGKPGEPINPNDPDGPKWPSESGNVSKDVTRTITFVDNNGKEVHAPVEQTVHFTAQGIMDKVTGKWVTPLTWSPDQTVSGQNVPFVENYHVTSISKDGEGTSSIKSVTLNHDSDSYKVVVSYEPNGKIVPVDPNGNKIPNVDNPTYPTDPNNPSKVTPNEPVPSIPGYTPEVPTVTPDNPGKDTPVIYTPIPADKGQVIVKVHDNTTGKDIPDYGYDSGEQEVGQKVDYNKNDVITNLTNKGYKVINPDVTIPGEITKGSQVVTIYVEHTTTTVTPDKPGHPGDPIDPNNPNNPDGPKYPEGTGLDNLKKTGTQTIHYTGADKKTPKDNVQSFDFTKEITFDNVTGEIIDKGSWNVTSHEFGTVETPVVDGYHADKRVAGGKTVTPDNLKAEVTVTYTENGKIVPVDPEGNKIPNVPTPTYVTDPNDPTKVVPDEPVPTIDGYTPSQNSVTPKDPGKDTEVVYTKPSTPVTPVTPTPKPSVTTVVGKQTITFVDGDNNNTPLRDPDVQTHTFTITDGVPSENSYTFGTVNVPVIKGYVAEIKTAGGKTVTPNDPNANVVVVYHKIGKIVPVDPDHNPIPGAETPQYKNDPNDPTKVVPDENVPIIEGYTPSQSTVTPDDPTKDTEVVYTKKTTPVEPDEPDTPDEEPEEPKTPKKHHDSNKPKPSTPKKTNNYNYNNAPHAQNGYWNNNVAPHGQSVNGWSNNIGPHGEHVDANGNIVAPNGEIVGYVDKNGNPHYTKQLPQTGEKNTDTAASLLGGAAAGLSLIGLAGVKKRRKKD